MQFIGGHILRDKCGKTARDFREQKYADICKRFET